MCKDVKVEYSEYSQNTLELVMKRMKFQSEFKLSGFLADFLVWMECLRIEKCGNPERDFIIEVGSRFPEFKTWLLTGETTPIKKCHKCELV